jgi:hypothetical protein
VTIYVDFKRSFTDDIEVLRWVALVKNYVPSVDDESTHALNYFRSHFWGNVRE